MGENNKVSLKVIIAAGALALGVATAVAALMGNIYCTKTEMAVIKEEVKDDMAKVKLKAERTGWEVESMAVRVQNIERRQIQMSENITKLLDRLRVRPVDPPYLKPMPSRPRSLEPGRGVSP